MLRTIPVIYLIMCMLVSPAVAQDQDEVLELFAAYQSGYMQVVAVACFQLYSSSGIISTDYLSGYIDGGTAVEAMAHNRLLLSVCTTTLEQVRLKTPEGDQLALEELDRLSELLGWLNQFMTTADDFFLNPSQETADAADAAQSALDKAMEEYAGSGVE